MILIAHRGNTAGPNPAMENNPKYIEEALLQGFDVEVDVWLIGGKFFLGHDKPDYEISRTFLNRNGLWCHAKNADALVSMIAAGIHCFWHQEDDHTITSRGYIWTHPNSFPNKSGIYVYNDFNEKLIGKTQGICSDYVASYRNVSPDGSKK